MQVDLCRHIKTNGLQCHGAALSASVFCYFHNRLHRSHDLYRDKAHFQSAQMMAHPFVLQLPAIEDRESAQLAISCVINALATGCINPKFANSLFYGLQLASANARGLRIVRRPTQVVRDVYKEPWVTIPDANPDIAPPGLTCEVEDAPDATAPIIPLAAAIKSPTKALIHPPKAAVILNAVKDPRILPAIPKPPATEPALSLSAAASNECTRTHPQTLATSPTIGAAWTAASRHNRQPGKYLYRQQKLPSMHSQPDSKESTIPCRNFPKLKPSPTVSTRASTASASPVYGPVESRRHSNRPRPK